MSAGTRSFRPRIIPGLLALISVLVLVALGLWQLGRAGQKQQLFEQVLARSKMPMLDLSGPGLPDAGVFIGRRASVTGGYHQRWNILLDNQVYRGQAGYHVYTPLNVNGTGDWILVNRGWIPAGDYRDRIPQFTTPPGTVTVAGQVRAPPFSGILLSENFIETLDNGVVRTQSIQLEKLGAVTGLEYRPYIMRLEPGSTTGFIRDYQDMDAGSDRHIAYAYQWFALAATVLFIFLYYTVSRPA